MEAVLRKFVNILQACVTCFAFIALPSAATAKHSLEPIAAVLNKTSTIDPAGSETLTLTAPGGKISVVLGTNTEDQPTYAVNVGGRPLIAPSVLGLQFERYQKLANGLRVVATERRNGIDKYALIAGKQSSVVEAYAELIVHMAEPNGLRRRLDFSFRAYATGVAFRMRIPEQPNLKTLRLFNELTSFNFPGDYACTGLNLGKFGTSHEGEFDAVQASAIRPHNLFELPFVCRNDGARPAFAIAEADVTDWPVMYLTGTETSELGVTAKLTPRPDDPLIAVRGTVGPGGLQSPWRVIMIAAAPGDLISNTLVTSLNPPPAGDFSWVQPGKTAWDWWSGPILASVPNPGTNDATLQAFIDFASEAKIPYMMIDDGWYEHSGDGPTLNPGVDAGSPIAAVNLPALIEHAASKNVRLLVWVHWKLLAQDMERLTALYERWGLAGIKVDFMDRDDQDMVGFYHRIAAATARHHLLLDLHGATHPWGLSRTYPNFITQEGVMGAEYNKWTRRVTARHNVTLAYTRLLTGPMDYTPGGFRNDAAADFSIHAIGPHTQTTRGQALAMYVVFESGLGSIADSPDAYRGASGFEFLREVPTAWDETRWLGGDIGEHIVLARRKGRIWYVGAMTNERARKLAIPLSFLGRGKFTARSWQDGDDPRTVATKTTSVDATTSLELNLASAGGAVAILAPVDR